ncbi:hypothetical protein SBF1_8150005 [Candidatus Desulfosporosinus infrequens]|uniref:Uncharacterized protein n=1 Tax=Candidatus Desulfosporosinus infrequens TaxID=2043169 RepID=A0A2U3LTQ9_9FIRM|nr:hypothetical protein SBF1_8150005 [Candidatus Desulfosporosinus infrequens]
MPSLNALAGNAYIMIAIIISDTIIPVLWAFRTPKGLICTPNVNINVTPTEAAAAEGRVENKPKSSGAVSDTDIKV